MNCGLLTVGFRISQAGIRLFERKSEIGVSGIIRPILPETLTLSTLGRSYSGLLRCMPVTKPVYSFALTLTFSNYEKCISDCPLRPAVDQLGSLRITILAK
jgi:hypothetical protein